MALLDLAYWFDRGADTLLGGIAAKCEVFGPHGLQSKGGHLVPPPDCSNQDYVDAMKAMFGKTTPTPISRRRYGIVFSNNE